MYTIYYDGYFVAGDCGETSQAFYNAVLTESANTAGSFVFSLPATSPQAYLPLLLKKNITLFRDGDECWRGRVVRIDIDNLGNRTFTCESALAFLGDIVMTAYDVSHTINEYFPVSGAMSGRVGDLLNAYNNKCSSYRMISKGVVSGIALRTNEPETYGPLPTAQDVLSDMVKTHGGYVYLSYESGLIYLNWISAPTAVCGQVVRLGDNLISLSASMAGDKICTRQYGHGHYKTSEGIDTFLGHYSVSNDGTYGYVDRATQYTLPYITGDANSDFLSDVTFEDVALHNSAEITITAKAFDKSILGNGVEAFSLGKLVRVVSPVHEIDEPMRVMQIETHLGEPALSTVTLGVIRGALTNRLSIK